MESQKAIRALLQNEAFIFSSDFGKKGIDNLSCIKGLDFLDPGAVKRLIRLQDKQEKATGYWYYEHSTEYH